jgi:hypothetical protein
LPDGLKDKDNMQIIFPSFLVTFHTAHTSVFV